MSTFEDHLLEELRTEHGADAARIPTRRRSRRAHVLAAGGGMAAATAAAAATLSFTATPATTQSYSIIHNPDGSLTVTLSAIAQMTQLNKVFASMGLDTRAVPVTADCHTPPGFPPSSLFRWPGRHTMNDTIVLGTTPMRGEGPERLGAAALPNGDVEVFIVTLDHGTRVPTCFAK